MHLVVNHTDIVTLYLQFYALISTYAWYTLKVCFVVNENLSLSLSPSPMPSAVKSPFKESSQDSVAEHKILIWIWTEEHLNG